MGDRLNRILAIAGVILAGAAIWRELRRPSDQRTWHGRVAGIPYDFRPPTLARLSSAVWSPDDPRILKPQAFGLGWTVNVGRLVALVTGKA